MRPHSLFGCAKRERAAPGVREKAPGALRCSGPPARTGVGVPVPAPIWPCLRARYALLRFPRLPSRGGWCGGGRGARTHLTSFSFRAFRFATRCPGIRRGRCPHRPAAEAFINHRPAAAKIGAACIPDIPGLKGSPKGRAFPSLTAARDCQPSPPAAGVCACADRPAETFFFSTGRGAFSFDVSKKMGAHPAWTMPRREPDPMAAVRRPAQPSHPHG